MPLSHNFIINIGTSMITNFKLKTALLKSQKIRM